VAWNTTDIMDQRNALIDDFLSRMFSKIELADRYQISRPTVNFWIARFEEFGRPGLIDRSSTPQRVPLRTSTAIETLIVETRRKHPTWGAKKLLQYLVPRNAAVAFPARSTVNDILDRHGLLKRQQRRDRRCPRPPHVSEAVSAANQRWCLDFKGQFRLGNGKYCYPLTVSDEHSRMLLLCHGLANTAGAGVRQQLERLFGAIGLPERIRSDNGSPFGGNGHWGLSRLNVWWAKLGIIYQPSRPGHPEDNGRHERMHRTLKQEATRPPASSFPLQQERFDIFRAEYNTERPHEAHAGATPGSQWQPSARQLPSTLPAAEYPGHFEQRRVNVNGVIKFKRAELFLSETLEGESIGLEETDDGIWSIWFYQRLLGRLNERDGLIR
jgi:putative transposase